MKALFQHTAITHGIAVRVAVSFLPEQSQPDDGRWFWVYHIRLENHSHEEVQLLTRHWRITDADGRVSIVDGDGVVGEQPILAPGRSHDYVSGCPLETPSGSMEGFYTFVRADGAPMEVRIPFFPLSAPVTARPARLRPHRRHLCGAASSPNPRHAMKRTHLPLNALRVYDAAARHLSFTRAADELAVTPAAVGQQIRALEDHLGTVLFRRTSKGLELTEEGAAGLEPLREGFLKFEESVQAMQAGQASDRYTIAAPREFYAQWLAPRLARFSADNPTARFSFVADETADFTEANLDCAIRLVDGPGDLEGVELAPASRVTVAAPNAPDHWIAWGPQLPEGAEPHITVSNAGQALSSAIAGMGRVMLPELLVSDAIADGRLVAQQGPEPGKRAYWLVAPLPQWRQKKVKALVAFLTA